MPKIHKKLRKLKKQSKDEKPNDGGSDSSSVDSKGNIKNLIDYDYDEKDSSDSDYVESDSSGDELFEMEDMDDRAMFLEEYGLKESGLDKLIRSSYHLLNLITYFTAGVQEVRAWTIQKGWKAPAAAGVIHTDFERGFIRAEVIKLADYVAYKTEAGCKEAGKLSVEGKEYVVQDGDIMHFRFNV